MRSRGTGAGVGEDGDEGIWGLREWWVRSDLYFLSLLPPRGGAQRVVVLTDRGMWEVWEKEKRSGRVGAGVEFLHVGEVPRELAERLAGAQRVALEEVTPRDGDGK